MLCNARGVHDASTAEWVVTAILASIRQFRYFGAEQSAGRWGYRFTGSLAGQTVLIVGYGSIGQAVEARLAGFDVQVRRVARTARPGVRPVADLAAAAAGRRRRDPARPADRRDERDRRRAVPRPG